MSPRDLAAEARAWLAVWCLRLRRRHRFRAEMHARLDQVEGRIDAIFAVLIQEARGSSEDAAPGYVAAAQIQARRREMRMVTRNG